MNQKTLKLGGIEAFFMLSFWLDMKTYHRFFVRQSQFYVLGNWKIYAKDFNAIINYQIRYPKAYIKFMYYCYSDFVCGLNSINKSKR
jgi:hypothetical protein